VGVDVDDIVCWEDEVEIRSADGTSAILGASPVHRPLRTGLGPVAGAAPVSAPDWVSGTGHALLDAAPLRGLTAPLRAALLPVDVVADGLDDPVRAWPAPLRQLVLHRVLSQPEDFLGLEPGNYPRRPANRTPVTGLVLAGDYTDQKWLSLMEGAVRSGRKAALVVADEPESDGREGPLVELRREIEDLGTRVDALAR
jgi:hypothetical protein